MKTAVRGGLLLISAGAGAAAVNAYYRAKYPADPSPAISRLLHNEVRRAQSHAALRYSSISCLPGGNSNCESTVTTQDPVLICKQMMLRLWPVLTGSLQAASAAALGRRDGRRPV